MASPVEPDEGMVAVGGVARHDAGPYRREDVYSLGDVKNREWIVAVASRHCDRDGPKKAWAAVSMDLYRTQAYFGDSFRWWIGVFAL